MSNLDTQAAWSYHNATKHSFQSVRTNAHFLDWNNQPRPFKTYTNLSAIPLPDPDQTGRPALEVLASDRHQPNAGAALRLTDLASILFFSAGITRRRRHPGGEVAYRAAACTGALYSIELYVLCGDLPNLPAGVYLFSPVEFNLQTLRTGDYRGFLVHATGGEESVSHAPATIVCTGTYWRNAWKYQARTYRHFGWDNGTILANMLAVCRARGLPARLIQGFADESVNRLLGLDTAREVALNLVPVGRQQSAVSGTTGEVEPLSLESIPYSPQEVDYPAMREMHDSSSLQSPAEAAAWRSQASAAVMRASPAATTLVSLPETHPSQASIEEVILRRGSSRRFAREEISFDQLSTALVNATRNVDADFVSADAQWNRLYVICHAVNGLEPGAYFLHRNPWGLEPLKHGNFRSEAGYLALQQTLAADCSAAVFLMADLNAALDQLGNRGYRSIQLEAGVIGGRLYLGSYAQRIGATGLTFYDDDVTEFFSPHAAGKSAIFLVALGVTARR